MAEELLTASTLSKLLTHQIEINGELIDELEKIKNEKGYSAIYRTSLDRWTRRALKAEEEINKQVKEIRRQEDLLELMEAKALRWEEHAMREQARIVELLKEKFEVRDELAKMRDERDMYRKSFKNLEDYVIMYESLEADMLEVIRVLEDLIHKARTQLRKYMDDGYDEKSYLYKANYTLSRAESKIDTI